MVKSYERMIPVLGGSVYGLVFVHVLVPQGYPLGKGLFVKKSGKIAADKVPKSDRL